MKSKIDYLFSKVNFLLSYPLHFSLIYGFTYLFGSLKSKIINGTFRLPHYAFGVYSSAKRAIDAGYKKITVIEFGVANGRGLIAMAKYSEIISRKLSIEIQVLGFDSGEGMPVYEGYRDHPEIYVTGDYPMQQPEKLKALLPENTKLILADLNKEDWTAFVENDSPVGFMSIDVDYYSSTKNILKYLIDVNANILLPNTVLYFDDILLENHNNYQGELLAINEFNQTSKMRKLESFSSRLKNVLLFYNAAWLNQIYQLHVLDHYLRNNPYRKENEERRILKNKYLK